MLNVLCTSVENNYKYLQNKRRFIKYFPIFYPTFNPNVRWQI